MAPPKRKKKGARLPTRTHGGQRGRHESTEKCQAVPTRRQRPVRPARADYLLENRPVGRAFTVKASLLLPSKDVPDDDGLRVVLSVHQGAESHQVSVTERTRVPISSHQSSHQCGRSRYWHLAAGGNGQSEQLRLKQPAPLPQTPLTSALGKVTHPEHGAEPHPGHKALSFLTPRCSKGHLEMFLH